MFGQKNENKNSNVQDSLEVMESNPGYNLTTIGGPWYFW